MMTRVSSYLIRTYSNYEMLAIGWHIGSHKQADPYIIKNI